MRRFLTLPLLGLGLLLPGPRALAQAVVPPQRVPGTAMTTGPQTDYKDFLFLASDRPVLLRLHLRIDGRPYHAPWDEYMKKFFAYCDRDNNGFLSPKELESVPNGQFLRFHLQGAIGFPFQGQRVPMQQMDSNKDGKVALQEFKDYYSRSGPSSLQRITLGSMQGQTNAVNDTIFKYLDANKDGKLTQEELAKASTAFQRLDLDDDEMIALSELAPASNVVYDYQAVQFVRQQRGL
jgi:Ca2+-binding EF-hand superfamily protein